jgi:hypothetical protein
MGCAPMGTQYRQVDPVERDLAAAQLDDIALANAGRPWAVWRDRILGWHLEAVARARAEALNRFYRHHLRLAIGHLKAENLELRRKVVDALSCARFYASGATDAGERAHTILAELEQDQAGAAPMEQPH